MSPSEVIIQFFCSLLLVISQILPYLPSPLLLQLPPLIVINLGNLNSLSKGSPRRNLLLPRLPNILATAAPRRIILFVLLAAVVLADGLLLEGPRVGLCAHAEPEVVPKVAAGAHLAVAVDGVPLAAEGVAGPGEVEGLAAGHFGWEEGFGDGVEMGDWGSFGGGGEF